MRDLWRWMTVATVLCSALAMAGSTSAQSEQADASLAVPEHGTGAGIADRELEGPKTSFAEGERVAFWTKVTGGSDGERIQHVWLREGEEKLIVGLAVNASHWRTWSFKNLPAGSAGAWVVEARDGEGRVLARDEFSVLASQGDS